MLPKEHYAAVKVNEFDLILAMWIGHKKSGVKKEKVRFTA